MPYHIDATDKPGSTEIRAKHRPEHLAYLDANVAKLIAVGAKLSDDGETGLLVTPGDVDAWTTAFADAFSDRVRLTQTWRDNALAFGAGFSAEAVATTYDALVAELRTSPAAKLEQRG